MSHMDYRAAMDHEHVCGGTPDDEPIGGVEPPYDEEPEADQIAGEGEAEPRVECARCGHRYDVPETYRFEATGRSACYDCVQDEIDEQSKHLESCKHTLLACAGYIGGVSVLDRAGIEATIREALAPLWDDGDGIRPKGTSQ